MPDARKAVKSMPLVSKLARLNARQCRDLALAVIYLGRARIQLPTLDAVQVRQRKPGKRSAHPVDTNHAHAAQIIARVQWAVPRAAKHVPWRSDCLVQATAGQNWLQKHNILSEIDLGARRLPNGALDAHAWLKCQDQVITGGDITTFVPFR